jgi:quercetin dioxygenase-like cupin family protein
MGMQQAQAIVLKSMGEIPWQEYPGHFGGALSKELVGPQHTSAGVVDFRISRYAPMAYVQIHSHAVQSQIYYVLEGEGTLILGDTRRIMKPHDYVLVPPGLTHGISNQGLHALVFFVITTPARDSLGQEEQ